MPQIGPAMISAPLLQAITDTLNAHPDGLNEREIRQHVLKSAGLRQRPKEIEAALKQNLDRFVGPLADGRWRLRSVVQAEEIVQDPAERADLRKERGDPVVPFLSHLPDLSAFIAFDLETTGINPHRDRIIQISAVRMLDGEPQAVFDEYVNLAGREIPYGLKVKLGFADHPAWEDALAAAAPLDAVLLRFREWAGDLPLVAHNARFDYGFLQRAVQAHLGWQIPQTRIVDSMELACLALPALKSYKLDELGRHLGVGPGTQIGAQVEAWAAHFGVQAFDWKSFHNAVVDVLVLAATLQALLVTLHRRVEGNPLLAALFHTLLPTAAQRLAISSPLHPVPDLRQLVSLQSPIVAEHSEIDLAFTPAAVSSRFEEMTERQGLVRRNSQLGMVEAVSRAFTQDRFAVIEAPTGTGKTFAYLVPSVLWARSQGETVAISTFTRLLQDQMADDLEKVSKSLDVPFRAQLLKGMHNYLCLERAAAIFDQTDRAILDEEERFCWLLIAAWLTTTQNGTLDEITYWAQSTFPALPPLLASLRAERGECSAQRCANCTDCFHRLAYEKAASADLVIINHALLLAKEWEQSGMPFTRVMIDEAHNLENAVTNAATDEVSWGTLYYLLYRLLDTRNGQGVLVRLRDRVRGHADAQKLVSVGFQKRNLLEQLTRDFGNQLIRYVELNQVRVDPRYGAKLTLEADPQRANPTSWRPVRMAQTRLLHELREMTSLLNQVMLWLNQNQRLTHHQEMINEVRYLGDKFFDEATLLQEILRVGYDRLVKVHWIEVERAIPAETPEEIEKKYDGPYRWAVKRAPVRVGPTLETELYTGKRTLVLTSATLRTTRENGFGFLLDRLGLDQRVLPEDAVALPTELDYSRALFGIARYLRADARPSEIDNFVDEVGQELGWFFRFTGGNGLALFTARARMQQVYAALEPVLGEHSIPVGCQGESGSRRALLEDLKTRPGSVLLGLKSFWEGVDVPGPNLSYVLMEKLPFPMLGEPIIRARAAEIRERDQHEFADFILPLMLIDFKQGFGRLIRKEDDIGVVLLLDKRVWNREYKQDLLASLPGMDDRDKAPKIILDETQMSRRAVYRAIADHMQKAPVTWQIDWDRMWAILDEIPEELLTHLEQLLSTLQLPDVVSAQQLTEFWNNVLRGLTDLFHFDDWRIPEQEAVVRALLTGQDALVVLPTGSGKSFTFQLPALLRNGTTLVFSPLKALMKDQVDKLLDRGLSVAERVDSSQSAEEQERVYQRMREGTARLVYIAPERIRDPKLIAALRSARNIVQVVVDEAHCVHMWGQSFRPDFLYIAKLVETIAMVKGRRPPVVALTATATPQVRRSIAERLQLRPNYAQIITNPNRPELRFVVYNSRSPGERVRSVRDKFRILLRILRGADRRDECAIVYVNTTKEAERLARRLETAGLDARCYHGQMDDQARKDVQDMFLEGQIRIIIATKAFGMGVDKSDIRYVIHYQVPGDLESYYQEAGRAGRDGEISWAILLYHQRDLWIHENYFIPQCLPQPEQIENVLAWLQVRWQQCQDRESVIFVDPREMTKALGYDEETSLGIHLHLLEETGLLHRDVDVTLKASTRLLSSLQTIAARATELSGGSVGKQLVVLLAQQGISAMRRGELDVVFGAQQVGVDPLAADDLLYRLALEGHLIYRSFARAYVLSPGENDQLKNIKPLLRDLSANVQKEMMSNLASIHRYAEQAEIGHCLRRELLGYFGEDKPATRRDSCCSLCDTNLPLPWADESVEDWSDPVRYQDAKFAILKAVAWNAEMAQQRGRSPYGAWTLAQIVVGNDYAATQYEKDEERRRTRRQAIVASEHFGVLEGLAGQGKTALSLLDELRQDAYICNKVRVWEYGQYDYPVPTERGTERLMLGKLFQSEHLDPPLDAAPAPHRSAPPAAPPPPDSSPG